MKPSVHLFFGTVIAILLYFSFNLGLVPVLLFWFGSWLLIDLDHFIYTSISEKELNPFGVVKKSFRHSKIGSRLPRHLLEKHKYPIFIFHGIEALVLIYVIAQFYSLAYYLLYGFLFHLIFDYVHLIYKGHDVLSKTSVSYVLARNKNKEKLNL